MPNSRWEQKKVKRTSKLWKNQIRLIAVRNQNDSQYKPVTWNELNCSCFCHIINILLTELSRSVWENLDLGRVYRPHCVQSVLTTWVKILPYRPPAQLIRANYNLTVNFLITSQILLSSNFSLALIKVHFQKFNIPWPLTRSQIHVL